MGLLAGLLVSLAVITYAIWIEPIWLQINTYALSQHPNRIRVAVLADLHLPQPGEQLGRREQYVIQELQDLGPDIVLFLGDTLSKNSPASSLLTLDRFLKAIEEATGPIPKITVLGNHEYNVRLPGSAQRKIFKKHDIRPLLNETTTFTIWQRSVTLIGLDDFSTGTPNLALLPSPKTSEPKDDTDDVVLVLQHAPALFPASETRTTHKPITLCVAGHTHGGQVTFFGKPFWTPYGSGPYLSGWYETTFCRLYVSRGIGTSVLPIRFGARSEIPVFDF